jgi:hypothetical protein
MKILNQYRFFKGAKGEAETPALVPPREQDLLRSISISESVDILCEGPIYGLVDQFGRKVYGLDMLKGIYLNKTPVMNGNGEYNFRNILMELNLGTENQKPLKNFSNIYISKPAGFKLLGPINNQPTPDGSKDIRYSFEKGVDPVRDFTKWARGWPTDAQDPFVYVHHIKNRDVKKIRVSLLVESLFDTVDVGSNGKGQDIGLSKSTSVKILIKAGLEGANSTFVKQYTITGTAQSPFAVILGESAGQFGNISSSSYIGGQGGTFLPGFAGSFTNNNRGGSIGGGGSGPSRTEHTSIFIPIIREDIIAAF